MTHHFHILHFTTQYPWQSWVTEQAREAAKCLNGGAEIAELTWRPDLARLYHLFFIHNCYQ